VARLALIPLALCGSAAFAPAQSAPASPTRWPEALRVADALTDDLARSRARVEVLYAAGDLPGALQEALTALRAHASDAVLLRRACQLALALRIVEIADANAQALAVALPNAATEESAVRWWRDESTSLSAAARELHARGRELDDAVLRARLVSGALILGVVIAWIGFGRAR
jgi:hypothetical protein